MSVRLEGLGPIVGAILRVSNGNIDLNLAEILAVAVEPYAGMPAVGHIDFPCAIAGMPCGVLSLAGHRQVPE